MDKKYRLSPMKKLQLAFLSMAVFYPILLFINSKPEHWTNYHAQNLTLFLVEYVCGSLMTFLWIWLAENLQILLAKKFGEDALGYARPGLNLSFLLAFLGLGMLMSGVGTPLVRFITEHIFKLGNHIFYESEEYVAHGMRAGFGLFTIQSLVLYIVILNRNILIRTQSIELNSERLEKENLEAQFRSLKDQVNPHFLFNSLNSLSSLIRLDPEKAEEFVEELSAVYRYLLRSNEQELILLEDELRFIQSYLVLLKTRFGEGFSINFRIFPEHADWLIPPLTLQLLVENAVKHNVISAHKPLVVEIFTTESDRLHVHNNFQKKSRSVQSSKVGLANIQNKFKLLRQPEPEIEQTENEFKVIVPLIKPVNYERAYR